MIRRGDRPYRVVLLITGGETQPDFGLDIIRSLLDCPDFEVAAILVSDQGGRKLRRSLPRRVWRNLRETGWFTLVTAGYYLLSRLGGRERSWTYTAERVPADLDGLYDGPIHRVKNVHAAASLQLLRDLAPDLCFHAGPIILKQKLLDIPADGVLGYHHGDLTRHRGRYSCFWEMYRGEESVGVTMQILSAKLDTGRIVLTETYPIGDTTSLPEMQRRVNHDSVPLAVAAVRRMKKPDFTPQVPSRLGRYNPRPTLGQWLRFRWRMRRRRRALARGRR